MHVTVSNIFPGMSLIVDTQNRSKRYAHVSFFGRKICRNLTKMQKNEKSMVIRNKGSGLVMLRRTKPKVKMKTLRYRIQQINIFTAVLQLVLSRSMIGKTAVFWALIQ
jgi:hypothetical protein